MPRFHNTVSGSQSTWIHEMPPTPPGLSESTELLNFSRAETHLGGGGNGGAAARARSEEATLRLGAAGSPQVLRRGTAPPARRGQGQAGACERRGCPCLRRSWLLPLGWMVWTGCVVCRSGDGDGHAPNCSPTALKVRCEFWFSRAQEKSWRANLQWIALAHTLFVFSLL
jgi:hypothetical protein